jgi:hypothetical protein
MARNTKTAEGKEPTGKEIRLASKQTMRAFNEAKSEADETITDARDILKKASDEAEKKHLHTPAFKTAKKLYDSFKLAEDESVAADNLARWLAHFDEARKFFKLDELANLQGRLFGTGEIGGEPRPPETDEEGEKDLRPRHLRQPGASAAEHVQELAAKAGVSARPDENALKNVGRGPEHKPDDGKLH